MTLEAMPWLGSPTCEWTPKRATHMCGDLATWHLTTHDFEHATGPDPNGVRTWMLCGSCALTVLAWAQKAHADGDGFSCRGCHTLITPTLGGFIRSYGELAHPEKDIRFDES